MHVHFNQSICKFYSTALCSQIHHIIIRAGKSTPHIARCCDFGTRTNDSQPMEILLYSVSYCDTVTEHMGSIFLTCIKKDNNIRL